MIFTKFFGKKETTFVQLNVMGKTLKERKSEKNMKSRICSGF